MPFALKNLFIYSSSRTTGQLVGLSPTKVVRAVSLRRDLKGWIRKYSIGKPYEFDTVSMFSMGPVS